MSIIIKKVVKVPPAVQPPSPVVVRSSQRVGLYVDGNNFGYIFHELLHSQHAMPNWQEIIPRILIGREISNMMYFREGYKISPQLRDLLRRICHGQVIPCGKSADIELALTAMDQSGSFDTIILASGDQDYLPLIRRLKLRSKRVELLTHKSVMSPLLLKEADYVHFVTAADGFIYEQR